MGFIFMVFMSFRPTPVLMAKMVEFDIQRNAGKEFPRILAFHFNCVQYRSRKICLCFTVKTNFEDEDALRVPNDLTPPKIALYRRTVNYAEI